MSERNSSLPTIPRNKPTLPPLPSLQLPLYVIPERRQRPKAKSTKQTPPKQEPKK
jgi:hypothetical protein